MHQNRKIQRIRSLIAKDKEIESILLTHLPLEEKRLLLRSHLSNLLLQMYDKSRDMAPLEWVTCRDAVWVLRNILNSRSEQLANFSLLAYLEGLLHGPCGAVRLPGSGFLAEFAHLLKGVTGKAGIYTEKPPTFLRHSGRTAARLRSSDLTRMARAANNSLARYFSGLDDDLVRRHSQNRQRLFEYFGITDLEWNDWTWQVRHAIRDVKVLGDLIGLSAEEQQAVQQATAQGLPFSVTPYYLSLMDPDNTGLWDRALRAQVIPPLQYVERAVSMRAAPGCSADFMAESDTSPIDGITRRYPGIVILKPILACPQICIYCQRNWQVTDTGSGEAPLSRHKLDRALDWIDRHPEIGEVLITGGDPLLMTDEQLETILARLGQMPHILRIRIGTRTPVTMPQRITQSLVRTITRFHAPGRREILIITHFEHPTEITPEAMHAVQQFRLFGVAVYNQLVFTYYNSRKFEPSALRQKLRLIGVTPYYTFNTKGKEETDFYRVPIARLLQEQQEEARLFPGTVRTDEIVFNVPRLGKNYLRAGQNRDMIAILPDGRRVYEFHPWEKKLALMDTYVYTDVSIYDYLQRLRRDGENTHQYRSIWYYY